MEMLDKLVGVPWDPTGVVRAPADRGHEGGEHVAPAQQGEEEIREWRPRNMYVSSDIIRLYGATAGCLKCRSVARGDATH